MTPDVDGDVRARPSNDNLYTRSLRPPTCSTPKRRRRHLSRRRHNDFDFLTNAFVGRANRATGSNLRFSTARTTAHNFHGPPVSADTNRPSTLPRQTRLQLLTLRPGNPFHPAAVWSGQLPTCTGPFNYYGETGGLMGWVRRRGPSWAARQDTRLRPRPVDARPRSGITALAHEHSRGPRLTRRRPPAPESAATAHQSPAARSHRPAEM